MTARTLAIAACSYGMRWALGMSAPASMGELVSMCVRAERRGRQIDLTGTWVGGSGCVCIKCYFVGLKCPSRLLSDVLKCKVHTRVVRVGPSVIRLLSEVRFRLHSSPRSQLGPTEHYCAWSLRVREAW